MTLTSAWKKLAITASIASLTLTLAACSASSTFSNMPMSGAHQKSQAVTVTDLSGKSVTVPSNPASVVATDNRSFQILQNWGVKLSAAPKKIMDKKVHAPYIGDQSVADMGNHREPNLEALVAAKPDLVINGQRYAGQEKTIRPLLGKDAAFIDTNRPKDMPHEKYFPIQVELLGKIFHKEAEASSLINDFHTAIERAKKAYNPTHKVMGLIVSGGSINYAAPRNGRSVGPLFPMLGLTPALDSTGSTDHEGDDVSIEAIAAAKPEWLVVLDRDQAVGKKDGSAVVPALDVIKGSAALAKVPAVAKNQIIVAPDGFYLSEDIILYTQFINDIAKAFEAAK
ncbi:iron complex transport system substrate-binding protein [Arcanobacterium wilhelmae]|uniref:Iron complex transport system substrate-binding protein n=1 Tax=Arcanobacterium wilhelmae TaxID=1803177 RepID=A0ABT9NCL5_9ACTO|nr:ABC transporter substrate-binding protein [Arcanobacterium wilhelmae]MDP9801454.1 iron complex transport system substrate-binding protein [Arcanobacterium wilhelmae]WFN90787.1 ABC transporter substrate-binding protein [Arcanobacterium wilhelmae]